MDVMKEFNTVPLEWALTHVIRPRSIVRERNEWTNDVKYLKLQAVVDICRNHEVVLQKKVVMGYPSRLLVVDEITSLHATCVVFDRHQKGDQKFYAEKLPCNMMMMMNEDGEADMIKGRSMIETTVEEATTSILSTPVFKIADHVKGMLKKSRSARKDRSRSLSQCDL